MRIQNNIMAMNTHRSYTINNNAVSKSAEKLSSGYRINRAGDDAAGLAISEKMRREIRGLSMASKNAQDGVSMVQTAEGALTEVHSMLQRMSELAVQAASDSNDTAVDRPALDQEFQQLINEIDQISKTTTFNDMNLLDGSFTGKMIQVGSNSGVTLQIDIASMSASALGLGGGTATTAAGGTGAAGGAGGTTTPTAPTLTSFPAAVAATEGNGSGTMPSFEVDFTGASLSAAGSVKMTIGGVDVTSAEIADADKADASKIAEAFNGKTLVINDGAQDHTFTATVSGNKVTFTSDRDMDTTGTNFDGGTLTAKLGAPSFAGVAAAAATPPTTTTPTTPAAGGAVNVLTRDAASSAIDSVKAAIKTVSDQRAQLGAVQNRLEHKIANLDNTVENVSAAESRIRDVDIAKEMTNFTKQNILAQAATAMLAQANAAPQNVLSLLQ